MMRTAWNQYHSPLSLGMITLGLLGVGLFLRYDLIRQTDFDGLYGQDAFAYYQYGIEVQDAAGELRVPDPMFWPLGFPVILATAFSFLGTSPEIAQSMAVLAGTLATIFIFALVYDLGRSWDWSRLDAGIAGIVAALLLGFSGQMMQSSVVVMSDTAGVMWAVASAWGLVRYGRTRSVRWLVIASIALGMATITRWVYGVLLVPWGLYCLSLWGRNIDWRGLGGALLPFALILGLQLAHSQRNPDAFYHHSWLENWDISNATEHYFVNADGTFDYPYPVGIFYANTVHDNYYLDDRIIYLLGIGTLSLVWGVWRSWEKLPTLFLLGGWVATVYILLVGIPYENIRFALAFFPPLVILAALGFGVLWRLVFRIPMFDWGLRLLLLGGIGICLVAPYEHGVGATHNLATRKTKDLAAIEWAESTIPEANATIYTLDLWLMMETYTPQFDIQQIYYETPTTLATKVDPTQPTYLFLNMWAIENQWVGKIPWEDYHWLDEHFKLVRLGHAGNYHLIKVTAHD